MRIRKKASEVALVILAGMPKSLFAFAVFLLLSAMVACTAVADPTPTPALSPTSQPTSLPAPPTETPVAPPTSPAISQPAPQPTNQPTATPPPLYYLGYAIDDTMRDFVDTGGIFSLYIQDLRSGETLVRNPDVAVAGMSLVKIPVMLEAYRVLDGEPNIYHTKLLTETAVLSGNYSANLLLGLISGDDDPYNGTDAVTANLRKLGLYNTFMAAPYDSIPREGRPATFLTPANSRLDITTNPDPNMQTTAGDLGQLLGWMYACAEGNMTSPLGSYAPGLTPEDCTAVLTLMTGNDIDSLLEEGVPASVPIAHKHGWIGDTHGDAGIVFAPLAPYVMVMLLHKPEWLEWEESSPLMGMLSQLTYGHFTEPEALYERDVVLAEPTAVVATATPDLPRAIVTGTQGIGLRLRAAPNGEEIAILPEGSLVLMLNEAPQDINGTFWQEVQTIAGEKGWVGADYLLTANE